MTAQLLLMSFPAQQPNHNNRDVINNALVALLQKTKSHLMGPVRPPIKRSNRPLTKVGSYIGSSRDQSKNPSFWKYLPAAVLKFSLKIQVVWDDW